MLRRVGCACRKHFIKVNLYALPKWRMISSRSQTNARMASSALHNNLRDARKSAPSVFQEIAETAKLVPQPPYPPALDSLFSRKMGLTAQAECVRRSDTLSSYFQKLATIQKISETLARGKHPHRCIRLLKLANVLGCRLKPSAYEYAVFHLAEEFHWDLVAQVVSLAKRQSGCTTVRLLNWRLRALVEQGRYQMLAGVLQEFAQDGLKANRRTYHLLISGFLRNKDINSAKQTIEEMEIAGFPVDSSVHTLVVAGYHQLGPDPRVISNALKTIEEGGGGAMTVNSLLRVHLDYGDTAGAFQILTIFDQTKIGPVIRALCGNTIAENNTSLRKITSAAIHPDSHTFSILLHFAAGRGDVSLAEFLIRHMHSCGVRPDSNVISALMHVFFRLRRGPAALQLVTEICRRHGIAHEPLQFLFDSRKLTPILPTTVYDVEPNVRIFNALFRVVLATNGLNGGKAVIQVMRDTGIEPNAKTVEHIINHLGTVENVRPRALLRVLKSLTSPSLRPTLRHIHIVLKSALRVKKLDLHGSAWNKHGMQSSLKSGEPPRLFKQPGSTRRSFDPLAGIDTSQLPGTSLIRPAVQSLTSRNVKSDRALFAIRVRLEALLNDVGSARDVFRTLLARGMHPSEYHFAAIMDGYVNSGDLKAAERVLHSVARAKLKPNVVMFTILIVGYARRGLPNEAMRVFQQMVASGIKPDVPSIDAIASAYFRVGDFAMARKVLTCFWPYIRPLPKDLQRASLQKLVREFRQLHLGNGNQGPQSKHERLKLHWKVIGLLKKWHGQPRRRSGRFRSPDAYQQTLPILGTRPRNNNAANV